jgi:predicted dehydrogenase
MSSLFRIGIIGCGEMGETHARCLAELGRCTVAALCDRDEARARRLKTLAPDAYTCADPALIFRDDALDAIYISTNNDSHALLGVAAARAGKHVLMEKPVALSLKDCSDLLEAVERSGIFFMTAFKLRFYPAVRLVREFIPAPLLCVAQALDERWPDSFWGSDPHRGGGNVLSQGCHAADLMCYLMASEPVNVCARAGNYSHPGIETTDLLAATVTFASGAVGSLVAGDAGRSPLLSKFSFQVMDGTRSAHLFDRLKQALLWDGVEEHRHGDLEEVGILEENREFLEVLAGRQSPPATLRDGVRATVLLLRAIESSSAGHPVNVEL